MLAYWICSFDTGSFDSYQHISHGQVDDEDVRDGLHGLGRRYGDENLSAKKIFSIQYL